MSTHISGWGWVCEERVALILGSLDSRNRQSPVGTFSVLPQWILEQIPVLGCSELHEPLHSAHLEKRLGKFSWSRSSPV